MSSHLRTATASTWRKPYAIRNAVVVEEVDQDPTRYLVLGPDRAGNLLEVVVMDRPHGPAVIHSMPMQAKYRTLLEERR